MSEFRYGRLMEVKEKLLEHKERELDVALSALSATTAQIDEVKQETARTWDEMTARCLTGNELSVLVGCLAGLDARRACLTDEKSTIENRIRMVRTELYDLEIELKMLEKLRSKTLQMIKKTRMKKEQKQMDEIALRAEAQ
jgi:flagellar export protein FliJ